MTSRRIAFLFFSLLLSTTVFGQKISELKIDSKQSILNGRAFFQFPTDAKNMAREANIMAADPNADNETRIILDIGKQRLVFFARELFATSGNDFLKVISKSGGGDGVARMLTEKDSLRSVLVTPKNYDSTKSGILINDLYVQTQDKTIFVIGAYINPEAFQNRIEFQKLSERVFATLARGNRALNFKSRTELSPIFEGKKKFKILLPEGYVVTKDKKYDFEVLKFKKVKDIADTSWLSLTIYTGSHPSYFYDEYHFNAEKSEYKKGRFLNKTVDWLSFGNAQDEIYLKEQKIPSDEIEDGLIVHIAMLGSNQTSIDELTKLVEKIQLVQ